MRRRKGRESERARLRLRCSPEVEMKWVDARSGAGAKSLGGPGCLWVLVGRSRDGWIEAKAFERKAKGDTGRHGLVWCGRRPWRLASNGNHHTPAPMHQRPSHWIDCLSHPINYLSVSQAAGSRYLGIAMRMNGVVLSHYSA